MSKYTHSIRSIITRWLLTDPTSRALLVEAVVEERLFDDAVTQLAERAAQDANEEFSRNFEVYADDVRDLDRTIERHVDEMEVNANSVAHLDEAVQEHVSDLLDDNEFREEHNLPPIPRPAEVKSEDLPPTPLSEPSSPTC